MLFISHKSQNYNLGHCLISTVKDTSCGDPVKVNSCQNGNSNQFITAKFLKLSKENFYVSLVLLR